MAKKSKRLWYWGVGGIIAILLAFYFHVFTAAESIAAGFFGKIRLAVFHQSQELAIKTNGKSVADYQSENQNLQQQLADLLYENASLQHLKKENDELKSMSGYFTAHPWPRVVAEVIGHDPLLENTLVINQGSGQGIKAGQAVVAGQGVIIGKVIDAGASQSTVLLVTDSQTRLSVTKPDEIQPIGLAQGEFGLSVIVDLIPQTVGLEQSDLIVTGNLDPAIPPGLILGKVNRTLSKESDLFKKVTVTPLLDFQNISLVSVITTP